MFDHPHFLIEGVIIAAYAIRARHAFIYVRGEVVPVLRRLQDAVAEAHGAGYLGSNILAWAQARPRSDRPCGAGAYICGEGNRTVGLFEAAAPAPLASPFPAVAGLYACPTVVQQRRVDRQRAADPHLRCRLVQADGHGEVAGRLSRCSSLSGHARGPDSTRRHWASRCANCWSMPVVSVKVMSWFWTPGGSSTPLLTAEHLDVPLDYEGMACRLDAGHQHSKFSTRPRVWCVRCAGGPSSTHTSRGSARRAARAPTGCRRSRAARNGARHRRDIDKLLDISDTIFGKSFCALADGAARRSSRPSSTFARNTRHAPGRQLFDPYASMLRASPRGVSA